MECLGDEGRPNVKTAYQLLQKSAAAECGESIREMGLIYEKGGLLQGKRGPFVPLVQVDLEKALQYYLKAVSLNDNLARNYLGSYYYNHTKDFDKAVSLFRLASEGS